MRRLLPILGLLIVPVAVRADDPVAAAQELLAKRYPADQPGAAVLVVQQGRAMLLAGYGLADLDKKTPITADTAFDLASVSKQFTAMAVMILAERGRLGYDDELTKWIPDMPAFEGSRPLKVRDLLNQTSGLIDYLDLFKGTDAEFARLKNSDLPKMFAGKKLDPAPGTKFVYSNSNYALLPLVVERASGTTFAKFVHENIFKPAGMTASRVMDDPAVEVPNRAGGYSRGLLSGKYNFSRKDGPVCGDGNVFTTVRDLVKWDEALTTNRLVKAE